jgi:hypothetical protein
LPLNIKTSQIAVKNPQTGQYMDVDMLGDSVISVNNKAGAVSLDAGDIFIDDSAQNPETISDALGDVYRALTDKANTSVISEEYDSTSTYAVGDYCIYEGVLYKCNTAIATAEAWTAAHWTATAVMLETGGGGGVSDVQVNGTSVVQGGVANVPIATNDAPGLVRINLDYGISMLNGFIRTRSAGENSIKVGGDYYSPIVPAYQYASAFYGLAKAAGDSTQSASANAVGTYTESAKSAISQMLNAPETVSGTTPSITAKAGVRYVCGECSTLSITAPASGCIDVVFTSGSTATVLTVTSAKTGVTAIKWYGSFDPSSLDANTIYEISILDGELGAALSWT